MADTTSFVVTQTLKIHWNFNYATRSRGPEADGAHAGGEPALAGSVHLIAGLSRLVGLGVHGLVDEQLGHHLMSSAMLTILSSNLGIWVPLPAISYNLSICGYPLSSNPDFSS